MVYNEINAILNDEPEKPEPEEVPTNESLPDENPVVAKIQALKEENKNLRQAIDDMKTGAFQTQLEENDILKKKVADLEAELAAIKEALG